MSRNRKPNKKVKFETTRDDTSYVEDNVNIGLFEEALWEMEESDKRQIEKEEAIRKRAAEVKKNRPKNMNSTMRAKSVKITVKDELEEGEENPNF